MPKFDQPPKDDDEDKDDELVVPERWIEARCHVCTSKYRRAIDRMLALGTPYSEVSRVFGGEIDRRSISNHDKKHLNFDDGAIRRIFEHEAQEAQEDWEEGVSGALKRRVYLSIGIQKALEALISGDAIVEPRDAIAMIQQLEKLDNEAEGTQIDLLQMQFNAFTQAIREIVPDEMWNKILERTKLLLRQQSVKRDTPQLEA